MQTESVPAIVIGAGVVGCAVAQRLAKNHQLPPIVLDSNSIIAEGVTSRNSGVIHAGIYYPPGSLKAETCIRGKILLKEWCNKNSVPWIETGKWIIGQKQDEADLADIFENAKKSGASGLSWKETSDINEHIPEAKADIAIYSAETGIIDPYLFSKSLLDDARENGAETILNCKVTSVETTGDGTYVVSTDRGPLASNLVFNCAGLHSDEIARMAGITKYTIYPWRGDYFRLRPKYNFKSLLYPVKKKNAPGLGVHLCLSMDGAMRLGPDVERIDSKDDFSPREQKREAFFQSASKYLRGLEMEDLEYDTCGIRPKLRSPTDKTEHDFVLSQDLPGWFNLIGIESPGLTAAMALAEKVCAEV